MDTLIAWMQSMQETEFAIIAVIFVTISAPLLKLLAIEIITLSYVQIQMYLDYNITMIIKFVYLLEY